MKSRVKVSIIFLMAIGFVLVFMSFLNYVNYNLGNNGENLEYYNFKDFGTENVKASKTSEKIYISDNSDWVALKNAGDCTGEGTRSNPYVIKDLEIDGGGSGSCLWIDNSVVFFRVENCRFYNAGPASTDAGITMRDVYNGQIISNIAHNNSFGMLLDRCENITVVDNTFINNDLIGVKILYTNNSLFFLNTYLNSPMTFYFDWCYANSYNSQTNITYTYKDNTYTNYLGNFWDGYQGKDENSDGVGDTPKIVGSYFHDSSLIDHAPLIESIESYKYEIQPTDLIMSGIAISNPTELSELVSGQQYTITWTSFGPISNVLIKLYKGETCIEDITTSTINDGSYEWTVGFYETGTFYKIYIQDANNLVVYDSTDYFKITAAAIPGYDLLFILSLICTTSIILLKRQNRTFKQHY